MTTQASRNNPKIKQIRQLMAHRKQREDSGLFVVEGIHHVGEAIQARSGVVTICYAPDLLSSEFAHQLIDEQEQQGTQVLAVSNETFASLAGKENPQGIIAVARQPRRSLADLGPENFKWGVALVAPQDPGNVGTILRTIDAVGASGLLLLDDPANGQYSTDPYHPSSVRASMGAIFWHPLVQAKFTEFIPWAKNQGFKIYGTSAHASLDYRQVEHFARPMILLMGSEREGLTSLQAAVCDAMVSMPMHGRISSLNLAVATGVMLYTVADKLA
jgi:TrmH family RNA methyltransferase